MARRQRACVKAVVRAGLKGLVVGAAIATVVATSGCDLRWETEPPVFPSPDAVTEARDALADAEAEVMAAAEREGSDADDVAPAAADSAEQHLAALGGVYVAYPGASATPSPTVSPAPEPTLEEAIAAARATAGQVAATTEDADLAFLARSIDLEWALRELWATYEALEQAEAKAAADALAAATASPTPPPAPTADDAGIGDAIDEGEPAWFPLPDGSTMSEAGFAPGSSTDLPLDTIADFAVKEDEARFAYETLAAQEFGPRRDDALARARLHAERSDALAALLDTDPRTALYQLRDAGLLNPESRRALERSIETDLAWGYAAGLDGASTADAAWLVNASYDAYARAMRTDGFTAEDLPTLPGLIVAP